ncbi:MAG: carbamoyltransferase HypF [Thioalkalispiraceae bacterium]|jgi:hydrogenase maturation protein HypF
MGMTIPQISINDTICCYEIRLAGRVQAVGFRPFVYRLAKQHKINGEVSNSGGEVYIVAQGDKEKISEFIQALIDDAPEISQPRLVSSQAVALQDITSFRIKPSSSARSNEIHVPPDYFTCNHCLKELNDPNDRRYQYPFINCTQCGPRYTLIKSLPYDRPNTSMAEFSLCAACEREYNDPENRRYHAEPLACPECGPTILFQSGEDSITGIDAALAACLSALEDGEIVAIKGVGGYHLCCDAQNKLAIKQLRALKSRPHKPLALMFPEVGDDGLQQVKQFVELNDKQAAFLSSAMRPLLLLDKKPGATLSDIISPGLDQLGVMMPYSPLHHLILKEMQRPIIATSANISGEPVLTDNSEVETRLAHITQNFLHHDRPVVRPADDSVFRFIAEQPRPVRIGRGQAPLELTLPVTVPKPMLACGGFMKNTVALAFDKRVVISPHIGEMGSLRSQQVFEKVIHDLQSLYQIEPEVYVCDAHPDYSTSRWARRQNGQLMEIFHHHAHAACVAGEFPHEKNWLVFAWDGVGYGMDGTLWGGETFYGQAGQWQRVASMRPYHLPGGDKAAREPRYSALAINWELGLSSDNTSHNDLLFTAWQKRINTATSTAVGRLFDAAAAMLGVCKTASFEGQAAMLLEARARQGKADGITLPVLENPDGVLSVDWEPLFKYLLQAEDVSNAAYAFHVTLAETLREQVKHLSKRYGDFAVGLTGGVFQNKLLCELVMNYLTDAGVRTYMPIKIPVNDGGLCYGQIVEASTMLAGKHG